MNGIIRWSSGAINHYMNGHCTDDDTPHTMTLPFNPNKYLYWNFVISFVIFAHSFIIHLKSIVIVTPFFSSFLLHPQRRMCVCVLLLRCVRNQNNHLSLWDTKTHSLSAELQNCHHRQKEVAKKKWCENFWCVTTNENKQTDKHLWHFYGLRN